MRHFKTPLSRKFVAASSQYLEHAAAALTAVPFTMACWFLSDSATLDQTLISINRSTSFQRGWALMAAGATAGDPIRLRGNNGVDSNSDTATGYTVGQWTHAAGVATGSGAGEAAAFINGTAGVAGNATNGGGAVQDRTSVGRQIAAAATREPMSGQIVWPAIWKVALSAADVQRLASGESPLNVRPESLIFFPDFTGANTEFGIRATYPLVNSGTTPVNGTAFLRQEIRKPRRRFNIAGAAASRLLNLRRRACA